MRYPLAELEGSLADALAQLGRLVVARAAQGHLVRVLVTSTVLDVQLDGLRVAQRARTA